MLKVDRGQSNLSSCHVLPFSPKITTMRCPSHCIIQSAAIATSKRQQRNENENENENEKEDKAKKGSPENGKSAHTFLFWQEDGEPEEKENVFCWWQQWREPDCRFVCLFACLFVCLLAVLWSCTFWCSPCVHCMCRSFERAWMGSNGR